MSSGKTPQKGKDMRIDYSGARKDDNNRFAIISYNPLKEQEKAEKLENVLEEYSYHVTFRTGGYDWETFYVPVDDRNDYDYLKTLYKEHRRANDKKR